MSLPFFGNRPAYDALMNMARDGRIPQTILLHGPEGVGKATLARRFAAALLGDEARIELDDLSRPEHRTALAEREKLPSEKRNEDPLLFNSHPDFVTFAPDGPLRQISIPQMRLLKERAQFKPLHGSHRVFLIDQLDRANEQAANSLLKVLEEPPDHLIILMTAANAYDLLPTIRSRSVSLSLNRLSDAEMERFLATQDFGAEAPRRLALAGGSPGLAVSIDLAAYDKRRAAMLALLQVASRQAPFSAWVKPAEGVAAARSEKLENYGKVLYILLEDLLLLWAGKTGIRNPDIQKELSALAGKVSFEWLRAAIAQVDELILFSRRSIQKPVALDAFAQKLRASCGNPCG